MAFETKQYLDIEGLKAYTSKILSLIANKADVSTVNVEIAALKALIGDVTLLGENYKNLVIALLAEINRAQEAEKVLSLSHSWGTLGQE